MRSFFWKGCIKAPYRQGVTHKMKQIKSKAAPKTTARKCRTAKTVRAVKAAAEPSAAPKAAAAQATPAPKSPAERDVTLTCRFEPGCEAYAVGSYNNWQLWDKNAKMADRKNDGVYSITLKLAPGCYEYKFFLVKDGKGDWSEDVQNVEKVKNIWGTFNSVLTVA